MLRATFAPAKTPKRRDIIEQDGRFFEDTGYGYQDMNLDSSAGTYQQRKGLENRAAQATARQQMLNAPVQGIADRAASRANTLNSMFAQRDKYNEQAGQIGQAARGMARGQTLQSQAQPSFLGNLENQGADYLPKSSPLLSRFAKPNLASLQKAGYNTGQPWSNDYQSVSTMQSDPENAKNLFQNRSLNPGGAMAVSETGKVVRIDPTYKYAGEEGLTVADRARIRSVLDQQSANFGKAESDAAAKLTREDDIWARDIYREDELLNQKMEYEAGQNRMKANAGIFADTVSKYKIMEQNVFKELENLKKTRQENGGILLEEDQKKYQSLQTRLADLQEQIGSMEKSYFGKGDKSQGAGQQGGKKSKQQMVEEMLEEMLAAEVTGGVPPTGEAKPAAPGKRGGSKAAGADSNQYPPHQQPGYNPYRNNGIGFAKSAPARNLYVMPRSQEAADPVTGFPTSGRRYRFLNKDELIGREKFGEIYKRYSGR